MPVKANVNKNLKDKESYPLQWFWTRTLMNQLGKDCRKTIQFNVKLFWKSKNMTKTASDVTGALLEAILYGQRLVYLLIG